MVYIFIVILVVAAGIPWVCVWFSDKYLGASRRERPLPPEVPKPKHIPPNYEGPRGRRMARVRSVDVMKMKKRKDD